MARARRHKWVHTGDAVIPLRCSICKSEQNPSYQFPQRRTPRPAYRKRGSLAWELEPAQCIDVELASAKRPTRAALLEALQEMMQIWFCPIDDPGCADCRRVRAIRERIGLKEKG